MTFQQCNPPHPGALIQRTYIDPFREITSNRVADKLGVARSAFSRLLRGESGISLEMAVRPKVGLLCRKVLTCTRRGR